MSTHPPQNPFAPPPPPPGFGFWLGTSMQKIPQIRAGNIDLANRPHVRNPDGSTSTVYSMTFQLPNGHAILVPGVIKNAAGHWIRTTDPRMAWAYYEKTGQHLGIFRTEAEANQYADLLHRQQAMMG